VTYPVIELTGDPRTRGRQYGEAARGRVALSIDAYREVFLGLAGLSWLEARADARRYLEPIRAFAPWVLEELEGLAEGAAVPLDEVLAINTRTEVMYAATARQAARLRVPSECTAFAVLPTATADGHTLVGQNWDWLPHALDTVVVLDVVPTVGPPFVTVVEAGLLAKTSVNAAGLAVMTNALATGHDRGAAGVPYHVILRVLAACATLPSALVALQGADRSSSANYLLAHRDGVAVDIEATPGDHANLHLLFPDDAGILLHTNHFLTPGTDPGGVSTFAMPSSPFRLDRLARLVRRETGRLTVGTFERALADHASHPSSICCHPDATLAPWEQGSTVVTVIADLDRMEVAIAHGRPCETPFVRLQTVALAG
jgi:isopenicillin-N N-acyltransferase-like protein